MGTKRRCGRTQAFLQHWDPVTSLGGIARYSYKELFDLAQSLSVLSLLLGVPRVEGSVVPQQGGHMSSRKVRETSVNCMQFCILMRLSHLDIYWTCFPLSTGVFCGRSCRKLTKSILCFSSEKLIGNVLDRSREGCYPLPPSFVLSCF